MTAAVNGPVSGLRLVFLVRGVHVQCLVLCPCGIEFGKLIRFCVADLSFSRIKHAEM